MIQPGEHTADEILSALVDDQLSPDEATLANAHLEACSVCRGRLGELQSVVRLVRALPAIEPPRDFSIGPRLVADPPNVVRLRRWYTVARASAASLAAVFVFLSAGALFVGSQAAPGNAVVSAQPQLASAPAAPPETPKSAAGVRNGAPPPVPAAAVAPAARARPAQGEEGTDQVSAATSVRPLPTLAPTPATLPTLTPPRVAPQSIKVEPVDAAAPLRTAAASVGLLALLGVLLTLMVRHRLRAVSISQTE